VWFRSDLRAHDHEALARAQEECAAVVPVFVFNPADFGAADATGLDKTGPYRAKFLLECVADLRDQLRRKGSELVVRVGAPEQVFEELVKLTGATACYTHQEATREEVQMERKVEEAMKASGAEMKQFWGSTLYHLEDLPFDLEAMPTTYGGFRERVHDVKIRPTIDLPDQLKGLPAACNLDCGEMPTLEELGVSTFHGAQGQARAQTHSQGELRGGEEEALQRLRAFVAETRARPPTGAGRRAAPAPSGSARGSSHKAKAGSAGANFSCKISPWLAMGCLSPRRMYQELLQQSNGEKGKAGHAGDTGINWLVFELLWRDFFRFITRKYGAGSGVASNPMQTPALG